VVRNGGQGLLRERRKVCVFAVLRQVPELSNERRAYETPHLKRIGTILRSLSDYSYKPHGAAVVSLVPSYGACFASSDANAAQPSGIHREPGESRGQTVVQ